MAASLAALGWLLLVYPKQPGPGSGRAVQLELAEGERFGQVVARLHAAGAVRTPWLFTAYARLLGADRRLRSGTVRFSDAMSPRAILQQVATGYGAAVVRVTVPEGYSMMQVAERLARFRVVAEADFLRAARAPEALTRAGLAGQGVDAASVEGYLFPDTYEFRQGVPAAEVVRTMVDNHRRRTAPLFERHQARLRALEAELGWTRRDVLTMASIVEKEAAVAEERTIIADVFENRLRSATFLPRGRLQADPTVAYGCQVAPARSACRGFDGQRITRAMLDDASNPYNTYRHSGLPPGPICNPGRSAIEAVLKPLTHSYLYFVARGQRRHAFSTTLEEHNRAVAAYRRSLGR